MKNKFLLGMIAFYFLGSVSGFALFGVLYDMEVIGKVEAPKENWMICFDTPLTQKANVAHCGPHRFDNFDSCARTRDWLIVEIQKEWGHIPGRTRNHRCNRAIEK